MKLNKGDTIGIIALSGECDKAKIEKAKENIESLGYKVVLSRNIFKSNRYLAGTDDEKLKELSSFYNNKDIKLILNARGGYGAIRLINRIDYNLIKENPKLFCGFSDITAILLMLYKKTNQIVYHGPMASTDFVNDFSCDVTLKNFFEVIEDKEMEYVAKKVYQKGQAEGVLWGGNLSTVVSLCGQDFIPDKDFIFFAEDLNEPVYKIDKMFQQLFNIEAFKCKCRAVILGDFLGVDNEAWLEDYFNTFNIPTAAGFKITHAKEKITLPIGKKAVLNNGILLV